MQDLTPVLPTRKTFAAVAIAGVVLVLFALVEPRSIGSDHSRMWNARRTTPPPGSYASSTSAVTLPRTRPE